MESRIGFTGLENLVGNYLSWIHLPSRQEVAIAAAVIISSACIALGVEGAVNLFDSVASFAAKIADTHPSTAGSLPNTPRDSIAPPPFGRPAVPLK